MGQRLGDRVLGSLAVAAGLVVAGCSSGPAPIVPLGLEPTEPERVEAWIGSLVPSHSRLYEVRPWRFQNERGAASGRAAIRVVPPDSLRFDYRGPFRRSGAAVIVGDSALWVRPEEEFGGLVALAPLFWGALGLPLMPPRDVPLFALEREDLRAWQYVVGRDTLNFVLRGMPVTRLLGEVRRGGRAVGVSDVELDPVTGLAISSKIDFPRDVSRFSLTVSSVDTLATFDSTIWQQP